MIVEFINGVIQSSKYLFYFFKKIFTVASHSTDSQIMKNQKKSQNVSNILQVTIIIITYNYIHRLVFCYKNQKIADIS